MALISIDADMLSKMFLSGAKALEAKRDYINDLNVFPVPDGDTGTNMTMTIMSAAKDVAALNNPTMNELGKAISSGSLRGARGNSGVILSQIFRGFVKSVKNVDKIDVTILANAVQHASDTAYKAVMKPKEGTILTVAKAGADKAMDILVNEDTDDIIEFCDAVVECMEDALNRTPEMLPVLKQAGVVDSGGEGLMTFLRGALDALNGRVSDFSVSVGGSTGFGKMSADTARSDRSEGVVGVQGKIDAEDIRYGYCTEFIIMLERDEDVVEMQLKEYLQQIGDCVVVVADDGIVKVHVHTNGPGLAIQKALTYGSLTSMKIDNMREEHNEKVIRDAQRISARENEEESKYNYQNNVNKEHKDVGFVAVSAGEGIKKLFTELGADYVIEGGQTMNPSTEDILEAIAKVNADVVFVLPNNGNIILAASQAANLTEDKKVIVIPSENIPQGITAMVNYVAGDSPSRNEANMREEMSLVRSGQVTYAVRDTNMDGRDIKQGDFMGLTGKSIAAVGKNVDDVTLELINTMVDEDTEIITLYFGDKLQEEDAQRVADIVMDKYGDIEVEVQFGGQPIYSYFISVE